MGVPGPSGACSLVLILTVASVAVLATPHIVAAYTGKRCSADYSCPHGGECFSWIHTSLCGDQYNVCVTWDYNCVNDYPAVYVGATAAHEQYPQSTGGGITGFPPESILAGVLIGISGLILFRRRACKSVPSQT